MGHRLPACIVVNCEWHLTQHHGLPYAGSSRCPCREQVSWSMAAPGGSFRTSKMSEILISLGELLSAIKLLIFVATRSPTPQYPFSHCLRKKVAHGPGYPLNEIYCRI